MVRYIFVSLIISGLVFVCWESFHGFDTFACSNERALTQIVDWFLDSRMQTAVTRLGTAGQCTLAYPGVER